MTACTQPQAVASPPGMLVGFDGTHRDADTFVDRSIRARVMTTCASP